MKKCCWNCKYFILINRACKIHKAFFIDWNTDILSCNNFKPENNKKLENFLNMKHNKKDLIITLEILNKFKSCEDKKFLNSYYYNYDIFELFEKYLNDLINKE